MNQSVEKLNPVSTGKQRLKQFLSWVGWIFVALYFTFAALILVTRFVIVPYISDSQDLLEEELAQALNQPVVIKDIEIGWSGVSPLITAENIQIGNPENPLSVKRLSAIFSYKSFLFLSPVFSSIEIEDAKVALTRTEKNEFDLNGISFALPEQDQEQAKGSSDEVILWLFRQKNIIVRNAEFSFTDKVKNKSVNLKNIEFASRNGPIFKRFALQAVPPANLTAPLDIRGELFPAFGALPHDFAKWNARLYGKFTDLNLAPLTDLVAEYSIPIEGFASAEVWLNLHHWMPESLQIAGAASKLQMQFADDLKPLALSFIEGHIKGSYKDGTFDLKTSDVSYQLKGERAIFDFDSALSLRMKDDKVEKAKFSANTIELKEIVRLFPALPLPDALKEFVYRRNLGGTIRNASVVWDGPVDEPNHYEFALEFTNLSSDGQSGRNGKAWLPGFRNFSGSVFADNEGGSVSISANNALIAFPGLFPVASFKLDNLKLESHWNMDAPGKLGAFKIDRVSASNSDVSFTASGRYVVDGSPFGFLDLEAEKINGNAKSAWKYVPNIAGKETIKWLRYALISGKAKNGTAVIRGPLHEFAWTGSDKYKFLTEFDIEDVTLNVFPTRRRNAAGNLENIVVWPLFTNISGRGTFEGDGMKIEATKGRYMDAEISRVIAEIPSFADKTIWLNIDANATGPLPSFLHYVNRSPVTDYTGGIFTKAAGNGSGDLDLALRIPLHGPGNVKVDGAFTTHGNDFAFNQFNIPDLTDVNGIVRFSEKGASSEGLNAKVQGEAVNAEISTAKNGTITVKADGTFPASALHQVLPGNWSSELIAKYISGKAPFTLKADVNGSSVDLDIRSPLTGISSTIEPFVMTEDDQNPLSLQIKVGKNTLNVDLAVDNQVQTKVDTVNGDIKRATFGIPTALPMPSEGIAINVSTDTVSVDEWTSILSSAFPQKPVTGTETIALPLLDTANISVKKLLMEHFNQDNLVFNAQRSHDGWLAHVHSDLLSGELEWQKIKVKEPRLIAHFSKLYVPKALDTAAKEVKPVSLQGGWPAIDAIVEEFVYGDITIGKVELNAVNTPSAQGHLWQIKKLNISNRDSILTSSGSWLKQFDGGNRTTLIFDNKISDLGNLLKRFNMQKIIRKGNGTVKGELGWDGTPLSFNTQSFDGELDINLRKGDILQIQPGPAAKLLSLLSLQSLTRYFTLDFRDFYSKGFTFDTIHGAGHIDNGLMKIDDLTMVGTGASVIINGDVNIEKENQDLHILVLPDINATGASIALAVANPIAGVGSLIAQLIFKDPLSKLFSFEYEVTGTWSEPVVTKVERQIQKPAETGGEVGH